MGDETKAPSVPAATDLLDGPKACPACSHDNDSAQRTWWDRWRGKALLQCRTAMVEQDALADMVEYCKCTHQWHQ